jgi:tRNA(Ile)-lysidine synthase
MIVARVRRTIVERGLIGPRMHVLAACSGGPDSSAMLVALARLCDELEFTLEAASIDHGLRAGAAADVEAARSLAIELDVRFHALRVEVQAGSSLQASARAARYAALAQLAASLGATRIAVGHTLDDQAETVLQRIMRGAGIGGLSGIEPLRADGVVRPLIDCRRVDVAAFALAHCTRLARDPSNADPRFLRTRVRNEILPLLAREDPAIAQHVSDLADDARAAQAVLVSAAQALLDRSRQDDGSIDVSTWVAEPSAVRRYALRAWIESETSHEPGRAQLIALERALSAHAEVWLAAGWVVRSESAGRLVLARDPKSSTA